MDIPDKALLNAQDMIKILDVGKTTFYDYLKKGYIPKKAILPLGVLRFKTSEIRKWLGC